MSEIEELIVGLLLVEGPMQIGRLIQRSGWSSALIKKAVFKLRADGVLLPVGRVVRQPTNETCAPFRGLHLQILHAIIKANRHKRRCTAKMIAADLDANLWTVQTYINQMRHLGAIYPAVTLLLCPRWVRAKRAQQ